MTSWPTSWIKARTGFCPTLMGEATYTVTHGWDRSIYGINSGIGNLLLKFEVARISEVLIVTGAYPWQHLSRSRGSLLPHRSPIGETKLLTTTALRPPKPCAWSCAFPASNLSLSQTKWIKFAVSTSSVHDKSGKTMGFHTDLESSAKSSATF